MIGDISSGLSTSFPLKYCDYGLLLLGIPRLISFHIQTSCVMCIYYNVLLTLLLCDVLESVGNGDKKNGRVENTETNGEGTDSEQRQPQQTNGESRRGSDSEREDEAASPRGDHKKAKLTDAMAELERKASADGEADMDTTNDSS